MRNSADVVNGMALPFNGSKEELTALLELKRNLYGTVRKRNMAHSVKTVWWITLFIKCK